MTHVLLDSTVFAHLAFYCMPFCARLLPIIIILIFQASSGKRRGVARAALNATASRIHHLNLKSAKTAGAYTTTTLCRQEHSTRRSTCLI